MGWGSPSKSRLQPGLPRESLARSQPCSLPAPCPSPVGRASLISRPTHSVFVTVSVFSLRPLQARVTLLLPPGWFGLTQSRLMPCPHSPSQQGLWLLLPVCKRKGSRKTISTQKRGHSWPTGLRKREAQAGRCRNTEVHRSPLVKGMGHWTPPEMVVQMVHVGNGES